MIFQDKPADFNPKFESTGCYILAYGQILLLLRHPDKPYGGYWNAPGGRIEEGECPTAAIRRELLEETGIDYRDFEPTDRRYLKALCIRYPEFDFIHHVFRFIWTKPGRPQINLKLDESERYIWLPQTESLRLRLLPDEAPCIELAFGLK